MGTSARVITILGGFAGVLGFSTGHFISRGRKQAFIMALASCMLYILLMGWLTAAAFPQEQNLTFLDALAAHPRDLSILISSAMFSGTIFILFLFLIYAKSVYSSFQNAK